MEEETIKEKPNKKRKIKESPSVGEAFSVKSLEKKIEVQEEKLNRQRIQYSLALRELEEKMKELGESRTALMNILEDEEEARGLAEAEKDKTQTMIASLSDGLMALDASGKVFLTNPQVERFLNVSSKEIIGKLVFDLGFYPIFQTLISILKSEEKIFRREMKTSKNLTIEVSTLSMPLGGGSPGTLIIFHDITREKRVEEMKTEFVSLSAHQLRTPLAAIKWALKMFLDGDMGEINPDQKSLIEKAYQSNERMISLINDLLDVTRIEEGKYLYKSAPSDLESVVNFVANSHQDEIKRKNIKLIFNKQGEKLPRVMMDVEKMRLVIQNLLENAIKYTPAGGNITIALEDKKTELLFKISDTGVGIPKDQQGRIFSKFFRGANVIKMETEGSGLGIFLAKNIIEAHEGRIWFESEEGKGTTFYFTLPIKKEFEEFLKEF